MKASALSLLYFILLSGLYSCAANIRVNTVTCQSSKAQFVNINENFSPQHQWEEKIWVNSLTKEDHANISLKELLAKKEIDCKKLLKVRYTFSQNLMDRIFSIVPFNQRMSIKLEVETI